MKSQFSAWSGTCVDDQISSLDEGSSEEGPGGKSMSSLDMFFLLLSLSLTAKFVHLCVISMKFFSGTTAFSWHFSVA